MHYLTIDQMFFMGTILHKSVRRFYWTVTETNLKVIYWHFGGYLKVAYNQDLRQKWGCLFKANRNSIILETLETAGTKSFPNRQRKQRPKLTCRRCKFIWLFLDLTCQWLTNNFKQSKTKNHKVICLPPD